MGKAECKVCGHPRRESIEKQLKRRVPYRVLAKKFKLSLMSLSRHNAGGHISDALVVLEAGAPQGELSDVERLESLITDVKAVLRSAQKSGKTTLVLAAAKEARAAVAELRRIKQDEPPEVVDLRRNPQWLAVCATLMHVFDGESSEFHAKANRLISDALEKIVRIDPNGHVAELPPAAVTP